VIGKTKQVAVRKRRGTKRFAVKHSGDQGARGNIKAFSRGQ